MARTSSQLNLFDLVNTTTGVLVRPSCPHAGLKGWTFDPESRLWVDPDPECRLPKHFKAQEEEIVPKISNRAEERMWTPKPAATFSPVKAEATGNGWGIEPEPVVFEDIIYPEAPPPPWWEEVAWPAEPIMICVDPGDVSCGVAFFGFDADAEQPNHVILTCEMEPDSFTDLLAWMIIRGRVHTVVYERFRLYADKADEQKGSEFLTSQIIGVIRWMVRKQNEHAEQHVRWRSTNTKMSCETDSGCGPGRIPLPVKLVGQMADIKKPTRGILRYRGIKSWTMLHRSLVHAGRKTCEPNRCHAVDAELHGWRWVLRGHARDIEERPKVDLRHIQAMGYDGSTGITEEESGNE